VLGARGGARWSAYALNACNMPRSSRRLELSGNGHSRLRSSYQSRLHVCPVTDSLGGACHAPPAENCPPPRVRQPLPKRSTAALHVGRVPPVAITAARDRPVALGLVKLAARARRGPLVTIILVLRPTGALGRSRLVLSPLRLSRRGPVWSVERRHPASGFSRVPSELEIPSVFGGAAGQVSRVFFSTLGV